MRLVLGVDSSTTACKAIAWGPTGEAVAEGKAPVSLDNPGPGAYEQDARQIWSSTVAALRSAVEALGPRSSAIEALCVTHQRETFVVVDHDGEPLAPAVVWMDARCAPEVEQVSAALGVDFLHTVTGKVPCTTPSLYKLLGLWRRAPALRDARPVVVDVHGFLARRLVGRFVTSLASADPMGLIDMQRRAYRPELLDLCGLGPGQVAELVEPGQIIGGLDASVARAVGLPAGLPVVAGAGDGQAAGLGAGVAGSRAYLNLGTALVCGRLSARYLVDRGFRTLHGAAPGTYFLEGDLKAGTFLLTWLLGTVLGVPEADRPARIAQLDDAASALPAGSGGLLLLPYLNGVMNPHWDDRATGALVGLRGDHGPAHLFRAALEGLSLEARLHLEALSLAGPVDELLVMGGGARSDLFCQIVADATATRVTRCLSPEATCLGAGMLAAVAAGIFSTLDEATRAMTRDGRSFTPGPAAPRYDALYREAYRPLYGALASTMAALARLGS